MVLYVSIGRIPLCTNTVHAYDRIVQHKVHFACYVLAHCVCRAAAVETAAAAAAALSVYAYCRHKGRCLDDDALVVSSCSPSIQRYVWHTAYINYTHSTLCMLVVSPRVHCTIVHAKCIQHRSRPSLRK